TEMYDMVAEGANILGGNGDISDFGRLLDESWQLKRSLTDLITTPLVDDIYEKAKSAGAIGGKLLGAGGEGFVLLFVTPEKHVAIKKVLGNFKYIFVTTQFTYP
ncbi:MAG TPA: kinase, partial [Cryomorphaceae bacterium]|nr:kinase [Cryomorphaceae bacterium]